MTARLSQCAVGPSSPGETTICAMDDHDPQLRGDFWDGITVTLLTFDPPKKRMNYCEKWCYMQFNSGICYLLLFLFGGILGEFW